MLKKTLVISLPLVAAFIFSACSGGGETAVAEFTGANKQTNKVTLSEFERAYAKTVGGVENAKKDDQQKLKNFLEVYTNFRMKLLDGGERGFDKDQAMNQELDDYLKQVGQTYIVEKELIEPAVKQMWERRKKEIRVSHIMTRPDSLDTEEPKLVLEELLKRIKAGESFEKLAKEYSKDEYSAKNGGDIYYITSGMIVPEFEDAAYKIEPGQVYPEVVTTRFGYHLIKVTESRNRIPQIRASHILIGYLDPNGNQDTAYAVARMDTVLNRLKAGENFSDLARMYSDDPGSKASGGDLGFFERRMMVPEFDEAAFNLKVGEMSPIVKTGYGLHLILVTDVKPYPTFDEDKENLKKMYRQIRYNNEYAELLKKTRENYNYTENEQLFALLESMSDTIDVTKGYYNAEWRNEFKDSTAFTLENYSWSIDSLIENMNKRYEFLNQKITYSLLSDGAVKMANDRVLAIDAKYLAKRNEEFARLMEDYRNGIYIFKLQEIEVWNKIKNDSTLLVQFYEKTKAGYIWPDRVEFAEIFVKNDSLAKAVYKEAMSGADFESLAGKYTERSNMRGKMGKHPLQDVNSSPLYKEANKLSEGIVTAPISIDGGYSIIKVYKKDKSRIKTYEEAKPEVLSGYNEQEQKNLEAVYIEGLKAKYKPVYFYDSLKDAFKN
ncbi:peptidylprolyl isomerase [Ignavibacteriales bacterium]